MLNTYLARRSMASWILDIGEAAFRRMWQGPPKKRPSCDPQVIRRCKRSACPAENNFMSMKPCFKYGLEYHFRKANCRERKIENRRGPDERQ